LLTRIDVDSENAFFVPILGVTPKDSLLIRKITGLNPPDVNLFIGDYSRDGGIYQGRRVGNRNVVITMDLNPNPALGETISGLREMLYKAFVDPQVDADYIKLKFYDELGRVLYLYGYTEKFETEIFDIETMAQISIICPDPYIRDNTETVMSHATGWTTVNFNYQGTAETGFDVRIHLTTNASKLHLTNNSVTDDPASPDYYKGRMIFTKAFSNGDVVRVCTVRGRRKATVQAGGAGPEVSIVGSLDPKSPWMELHSQSNVMRVYGTDTDNIIASVREVRYTQAYWGI
jgi:Phage tail protein